MRGVARIFGCLIGKVFALCLILGVVADFGYAEERGKYGLCVYDTPSASYGSSVFERPDSSSFDQVKKQYAYYLSRQAGQLDWSPFYRDTSCYWYVSFEEGLEHARDWRKLTRGYGATPIETGWVPAKIR